MDVYRQIAHQHAELRIIVIGAAAQLAQRGAQLLKILHLLLFQIIGLGHSIPCAAHRFFPKAHQLLHLFEQHAHLCMQRGYFAGARPQRVYLRGSHTGGSCAGHRPNCNVGGLFVHGGCGVRSRLRWLVHDDAAVPQQNRDV